MRLKKRYNFILILIYITLLHSCSIGVYNPGGEVYSVDNAKYYSESEATKSKSDKSRNTRTHTSNQNKKNATKQKTNQENWTNRIVNKDNSDIENKDELEVLNKIILNASKHIGTPYKYGGTTPKGFDCSGYVQYVFKTSGVNIPRMSEDMDKMGYRVNVEDLRPGDLVYFKGRDAKSSRIGHVAIVVKKTETGFEMIHSTSGKGVIINNINDYDYWKQRFLFASRFKTETLLGK